MVETIDIWGVGEIAFDEGISAEVREPPRWLDVRDGDVMVDLA